MSSLIGGLFFLFKKENKKQMVKNKIGQPVQGVK